ncbi:hypothetical protein J31TS4_18080 [Paenibacillus sp. J31TS4]|uniref:DUF1294 domain-containing protein n=1 Tax=Paenibacillus sp. J31TS4 TaxID=2807195 RepID=UPI001B2D6B4E|nr:DUF1294 domain-containing protein [Paenibacillus sp. J31TS4]GIP38528.1 hypothetical protein J31TS4_18080 [Paenibacillus sp. J31TS4]
MKLLLMYLALINLAAFLQMGRDKAAAKGRRRRTPEKSLFLTALLGGSLGAWIGMEVWRHKTKHASFRFGIPAILFAQAIAFGYWWYRHTEGIAGLPF